MPERISKNHKAKKWLWIGGLIVVLALLLFIGLQVLNYWLPRKLETMVHEQSKGVYKLDLYSLQASPFTSLLSVDSLSLKPDLLEWKEHNKTTGDAPRMLMNLKAGKVELTGLSYWNVLRGKAIEINGLSVASPAIQITRVRQDTTTQHEPMHVAAKGMLQGLKIDSINVRQGSVSYSHEPDQKVAAISVKDFDMNVNSFQLDSQSFHATDRAYYAKAITFEAKETDLRTLDGFYRIKVGPVKLATNKGSVSAADLKLIPLLQPAEMAGNKGESVTYIKSNLASIQINGIQFARHSMNNDVLISEIVIKQPSLSIYKDKKNFKGKGIKPLPHDVVQKMKIAFYIDNVKVQGMYVRYDELAEKATEPGHLVITNLNGTISNLSNIPGRITHKKPAIVRVTGKFMDDAVVKATLEMPLLDKNGYHTLEAEVGRADPNLLNPILEPTNQMSVKSGKVQKGFARMELNRNKATGTMRLLYQDFKVELLSDSRGNQQSLGKKVLTKAVNALIIKSANPSDKGEIRIGTISVTRDPKHSVFTFWKDGLASGFLSSIGLGIISEK